MNNEATGARFFGVLEHVFNCYVPPAPQTIKGKGKNNLFATQFFGLIMIGQNGLSRLMRHCVMRPDNNWSLENVMML